MLGFQPYWTEGHRFPQTRYWHQSLQSSRDRPPPATGWKAWCLCVWSSESALQMEMKTHKTAVYCMGAGSSLFILLQPTEVYCILRHKHTLFCQMTLVERVVWWCRSKYIEILNRKVKLKIRFFSASKLTVFNSQDDISEVKTSLLFCEWAVCGHLHHWTDKHVKEGRQGFCSYHIQDPQYHSLCHTLCLAFRKCLT